ncbi:uncharacterized protein TM35_001991020 [Trypanosoma theileri]|uniref:Transmembrane protein n=1 Tax=Trypanosoma theileri TaxID=67003 RepID=A0A1X0NDT0_9TRYP|nr:uncharacterized protein TM35_001991020 [Trypanosoma theileri]ORC79833.1 hypothetical protein TM35_001991020 [Trypanosoma theileri]
MPRTPFDFHKQGASNRTADKVPTLPPPDMAEVQKLIDNAVARARAAAALKERKSPKRADRVSLNSPRDNSPLVFNHQSSTSTRAKDFICAFVVTLVAIYFALSGYFLYQEVGGFP